MRLPSCKIVNQDLYLLVSILFWKSHLKTLIKEVNKVECLSLKFKPIYYTETFQCFVTRHLVLLLRLWEGGISWRETHWLLKVKTLKITYSKVCLKISSRVSYDHNRTCYCIYYFDWRIRRKGIIIPIWVW